MRPAYALLVVAGPDKATRLFLGDDLPPRVLVGTSPVCQLRLTDREVSRRHVAFEIEEGGLRMVDLESTNGTRVAGLVVHDVRLSGGHIIQLGATELKVLEVPVADDAVAEPHGDRFGRLLGASELMRRLYPQMDRAAAAREPVLIEGATGTGKDLLAECLHEQGPRRDGPFVVVDCAALRGQDADAALFGIDEAADARERLGAFVEANGGTLVLDEIGELDLEIQARLLRAIERAEIRPLGATTPRRVDVRIVTTTRHDPDRLVQDGKIRDDLFFRIAVLRIELPPLRSRAGDVKMLAEHFWRAQGADTPIPDALLARLDTSYRWPGNVRELQNMVSRAMAMGDTVPLRRAKATGAEDSIERVLDEGLGFSAARERVVGEFERRYIERLLNEHGGNVARAAAASGIARRYFQIVRARHRTAEDEV